ncbi:MaoC family dehydratase [Kutzneria buriramensis]|uniref:MaoC dehydratase-like protein n=1 Tax=Kutzneria buriramensis TaxID=1045776 RepID=A0A3E0HZA3_9PSEU|nr:MaoC family dehydratase [Kutzneria buriramensis]REH51808.1 MaoC dehydratase-like protein [Kutzneria buriramensis]
MIDFGILGRVEAWRKSWTPDDVLRYAVGVGADELPFTTENSAGVVLQALPTMALALTHFTEPAQVFGDVDTTRVLHAEQSLVVHRPLPVAGEIEVRRQVTDIFDKGTGALIVSRVDASLSGEPVFSAVSSAFLLDEGGFGGSRGSSVRAALPSRSPDRRLEFATAANQALIYRLSGDRNPLHSDPAFAARGGLKRPILHGLCTYGITCRLLVGAFCAGDAHRVSAIAGRFTAPVVPGDVLVVEAWQEDSGIAFRTSTAAGTVVIDNGRLTLSG